MAGYSGTPLPKKLGIKEDAVVAFIDAPPEFEALLGALPDGVRVREALRGRLDVIVAFFVRRPDFERRLPALRGAMTPAAGLWIA